MPESGIGATSGWFPQFGLKASGCAGTTRLLSFGRAIIQPSAL